MQIVKLQLVVEPAATPPWTQGQARDHRYAIVVLPVAHDGRLAARRPGAPDGGDQLEARFVREDEARVPARGSGLHGGGPERDRSLARIWPVLRVYGVGSCLWPSRKPASAIIHDRRPNACYNQDGCAADCANTCSVPLREQQPGAKPVRELHREQYDCRAHG